MPWSFVGRAILALPALHIAFCFIFLFFYQMSFGYGIEEFFSPSDIFRVSFRDIAYAYLATFLALPLVVAPSWTARKLTGGSEGLRRHSDKIEKIIALLMAITAIFMLVTSILHARIFFYLHGIWPLSDKILIVMDISFLVFSIRSLIYGLSNIGFFTASALFPFFVVAQIGASNAEKDRTETYKYAQYSRIKCDSFSIKRRFDNLFLAIDNENRNYLIDENCKRRFFVFKYTGKRS